MVCNVYADDSIYIGSTETLTVEQTQNIIGGGSIPSSIPAVYFDGQTYQDTTFTYEGNVPASAIFDQNDFYDSSGYLSSAGNFTILLYRAPVFPSNSGGSSGSFTVKLQPSRFTFPELNFMSISCGISCAASDSNLIGFGFDTWDYTLDGVDSSVAALPKFSDGSGYSGVGISVSTHIVNNWNMYFRPIVMHFSNSDSFSLTSGNVTFNYVFTVSNVTAEDGGGVYFYVTTPTVSTGYVWDDGLEPDDPDDDSGILKTIKNTVLSILDSILNLGENIANFIISGLRGLFVPDDDDLTAFKADLDDLLSDTFGPVYESNSMIHSAVDDIKNSSGVDSTFHFPGVYFRSYTIIPEQDVLLKPAGMDYLFESLSIVIDLVCTLHVINMFKHRFEKAVLENDG